MDPMVSARVPVGLRDQVNKGLRERGLTPTELINQAYEYFMKTGKLPGENADIKPGRRKLNAKKREAIVSLFEKATYPVPEGFFADRSYDDILADELRQEYEAFS